MIIYAMDKYKVNATQVFVTGGSSGGMSSRFSLRFEEILTSMQR
tara:strand:- start:974 stop:1105 length:132 start_codon:yes stop_codon:yes gene_type:complete